MATAALAAVLEAVVSQSAGSVLRATETTSATDTIMATRTASQIERAAHGEIRCDRFGTTIQSYPHHRTHSVGRHYGRRLTTGRTKRWRTLFYYTWSI